MSSVYWATISQHLPLILPTVGAGCLPSTGFRSYLHTTYNIHREIYHIYSREENAVCFEVIYVYSFKNNFIGNKGTQDSNFWAIKWDWVGNSGQQREAQSRSSVIGRHLYHSLHKGTLVSLLSKGYTCATLFLRLCSGKRLWLVS